MATKQFVQCVPGEDILINYNPITGYVSVKAQAGTILIPATVLEQTAGGTKIAFQKGATIPKPPQANAVKPVDPQWARMGFIEIHEYGNHCFCEANAIPSQTNVAKTRNEKPCKNCKRPNDVGVGACWWCELDNPTT